MHGTSAGDSASMLVSGTLSGANPTEGVIDYIDFGDGQNNKVVNTSDQGIAVNFGTALHDVSGTDIIDASGNDEFIGSASTDSDLIDLRGVDGALSITDVGNQHGSVISIQGSGNIDIDATDVDLLYVSQLDASGTRHRTATSL